VNDSASTLPLRNVSAVQWSIMRHQTTTIHAITMMHAMHSNYSRYAEKTMN
jgi:hypothetical protein